MPVITDEAVHHLRIECDGKPPAGLGCSIVIETYQPTREDCNYVAFSAGWRLSGSRTLCNACVNREIANCAHVRLDEDGICRQCGADCRGAH